MHLGYVQTELVRPFPIGSWAKEGDELAHSEGASPMDADDLRVAYFIRRTQIQWMVPRYMMNYCMKQGAVQILLFLA